MKTPLVSNIDKDIKTTQNIDVRQIQNGNGICFKTMDYEFIFLKNEFFKVLFKVIL